ncbi:MAG TPA: outer membrane protein assembly factor BamA [Spirochaetota bacterium]|nr:outer membrane protein assembly factor BamA [Spirochaetota bacterium]
MKKRVAILFIFLFSMSILYSQEGDSDSGSDIEGKIVYKVIFKGLKKVKSKDLIAVQMLKDGMPFDASLIDLDYKSFFELDYFEDIIVKTDKAIDDKTGAEIPGMINVIFEFIEKPTIRKILFKGNNNIPYGYLIGDVKVKKSDFLKKSVVIGDIYALKEKYQKKGFNYIEIDYEVFQNEELKAKNQIDLIFNINEGIETYVSEIILTGNTKFTEFTLKNKMKTKERKFLGLQKGIFVPADFYQDIEDMKKYYKDNGYYQAEIVEPEINRYEIEEEGIKKEIIKITINIIEGKQYKFAGMEIEGNKIFTTDDLIFNMKQRQGQVLNNSKIQEDIFSINKKYNDAGYVETAVASEPIIDDVNSTIKFKISIRESKLSYIEAVYFKGNTKTKNYVLYRSVYTEVGQIFDSSKLIASIYGLNNLGFFSKVEPDIKNGSAPGLLKITYILEEQSTAEIRFGMQITTNKWPPDITLFGELTEKNFFGRELVISGKVDLSLYKQGFEFSLQDPWFLNYPWSLGTSVKFYHNWTQKVLRKLTIEDYENYNEEDGSLTNPSDQDIRDFYDNKYVNKDEENPNYIGHGPGQWWSMGVSDLTFEIGLSTGYRFLKYFSVFGQYSLSPIYTFMIDNSLADQLNSTTYRNMITQNNGWSIKSTLSSTFAFNTTKQRINPYDGLKFSLTGAYTWGSYDYLSLSTKFTFYWNILDLYFNDWPFKHVLVFNAAASFIFPGFRNLGGQLNGVFTAGKGPIVYPSDYLMVDGFFVGRGWSTSIGATNYEGRLTNKTGYARFDFSLEYRIPIHEKFIWLAGFIDMVNLIEGPVKKLPKLDASGNVISSDGYYDYTNSWMWWNQLEANDWYDENMSNWYGVDNWYGSVGVGFQITFPQLPLSFYVVKRFKINSYSGFEWVSNQPETGNLDFVLSIVGFYF